LSAQLPVTSFACVAADLLHLLCLPLLTVQATAKLSAAEGAGSAAERDALVAEALQGLLAVPQCVNLAEFVPRLAFLRQYKVGSHILAGKASAF
jgi:hypothetical protein